MPLVVDLAARFLSRLDAPKRLIFQAIGDLSARLRAKVDEARAAHPDVAMDEIGFIDDLAARAEGDLSDLRAADLHLATACARGDARALAAFDRAHG